MPKTDHSIDCFPADDSAGRRYRAIERNVKKLEVLYESEGRKFYPFIYHLAEFMVNGDMELDLEVKVPQNLQVVVGEL